MMSDRAEDLNEWRSEQYAKNAKSYEPKVWLTVEEACEILDYLGYLLLSGGRDSFLKGLEKCNQNLYERIELAEVQNEIK